MQKMCKYTDLNKAFCSTSRFLILIFVCCVMSWSLGRGRVNTAHYVKFREGRPLSCLLWLSLGFFWFEKGGFRPCLCLLEWGGGYTPFSVCWGRGGGAHFRPEPFAFFKAKGFRSTQLFVERSGPKTLGFRRWE